MSDHLSWPAISEESLEALLTEAHRRGAIEALTKVLEKEFEIPTGGVVPAGYVRHIRARYETRATDGTAGAK
jgi:hypothetical protein